MRHGISLLPDCRPARRGPTAYFADAVRIAEVADELGYGYVKMTEHYMRDYGGYCPSPLTYLAAVAVSRSLSLTRSSFSPRIRVVPDAVAAITARIGYSSIMLGACSHGTSTPCR